MAIGTSDGQRYDSEISMLTSLNTDLGGPVTTSSDAQKQRPVITTSDTSEFNIDREHHVPLVASAILDKDGSPTGDIAIDHRVPPKPEYEPYLHLHEMSEMFHMRNLIKAGMSPTEAYHEAHDNIATPLESKAVEADLGPEGLEAYKKYWREAASIASEPSDKPRHPMAHTTVHGLDEGEGAYKVAMAGEGDLPNLFTGQAAEPPGDTAEEKLHDKSLKAMEVIQGGGKSVALKPLIPGSLRYTVHLDNDPEPVASLNFKDMGNGHYYLSDTGGKHGLLSESNQLGPSVVRKAFREFIKQNPDATRISAYRITGARQSAGTTGLVDFDVKDGKLVLNKERSPTNNYNQLLRDHFRNNPPSPRSEEDLAQHRILEREDTNTFRGPLRARSGAFIPNDSPLAERGPAQFRNAMRRIGVTPRYYEGQEEMRQDFERQLPISRPGSASLLQTKKALLNQE